MNEKSFTITLTVKASIKEVFQQLNNVTAWWTDELTGNSQKLNDVFTVQFADMHVSTQKLIEVVPDKKLIWLVTDSNLSFIKDKQEWTNTTISFELFEKGDNTELLFTHHGLVPTIECYKDCTKGWDYYIKGSLYKLLTEGKGTPGL